MTVRPKPFVVIRNKHIVPKQRRIEHVPPGYAVQEFHNGGQGRYWYVITNLEVVRAKKRRADRA